MLLDSDEVIEPQLLETFKGIAAAGLAERVYVHMDTYWKSPQYVIRPREPLTPVAMIDVQQVEHVHIRDYAGGRAMILGPEYGVLHHLSYAGPDERIKRKISSWSHRDEVDQDWYRRVWQGWDSDKLMRNLHPTHPPNFGFTERIQTPSILKDCWDEVPAAVDPEVPSNWPKLSVVIPLYGGEDDIGLCLQSLTNSVDLIQEIIVVDDCSPDNAALVAESFSSDPPRQVTAARKRSGVKAAPFPDFPKSAASLPLQLFRNPRNLGFGASCNRGYVESTGDVVLFLNSDTIVPRAGLIRLIESLMKSGTIAAAGPFTNNAGYHQPVEPTYTRLETIDLFARDFAFREADDQEVPILVGFCLAVRRSVIEEIGEILSHQPNDDASKGKLKGKKKKPKPADAQVSPTSVPESGQATAVAQRVPFDGRFGRGLFEDNDLCYRIQRANYRLVLSARSYVHHSGSKSLARMDEHPNVLLVRNMQVYEDKWREELATGYASHLPGHRAEPIVFRHERHPDAIRERIRRLAKKARVSLCMIVKNEERVLDDCLKSACPAFMQTIVVDTGSTDRTQEIALEHGAELHEFPWTDSFSEARNESFRYAKGNWIFWLDADDTLPLDSAEAILNSAINAQPNVIAFVVPVQFVGDIGGGTRVDHVKLIRNVPGLKFEGRIHEQILPSIDRIGGEIRRIEGAIVLHSGYDTSPEGQARKRERDDRLLDLDLQDEPDHTFRNFNKGMTEHYYGNHTVAIKWLERSIQLGNETDSHMRKAYDLLGTSKVELGEIEGALATYRKGLEVVGEDPELRFHLANLLSLQGNYREAKDQYIRVPSDVSRHFTSFDIGVLGPKLYHNLAGVCEALGEFEEAIDWWRKGIEARFVPSACELFRSAMSRHDLKTSFEAVEAVKMLEGPSECWAELQSNWLAARGEDVLGFLRLATRQHPYSAGPRLVLMRQLLALNAEDEALPHMELLDALGSAEAAFCLGTYYTVRGRWKEALDCKQRSFERNPTSSAAERDIEGLQRLLESEGGRG